MIQVLCSNSEKVSEIAELCEKDDSIIECWRSTGDKTHHIHFLTSDEEQELFDSLQEIADREKSVRIIVQPVDTSFPKNYREHQQEEKENRASFFDIVSREEMLELVQNQSHLNGSYLALVFLSAILATIALAEGMITILIGAMVLTPLLGPNLGLAFATATADTQLAKRAALSGIAGLALSLVAAALIGFSIFGQSQQNFANIPVFRHISMRLLDLLNRENLINIRFYAPRLNGWPKCLLKAGDQVRLFIYRLAAQCRPFQRQIFE